MPKDRSQKPEFRSQEAWSLIASVGCEISNCGMQIGDCGFRKAKSVMEIDLNNFANRNLQSEMIE
jgi:hypothetical protein